MRSVVGIFLLNLIILSCSNLHPTDEAMMGKVPPVPLESRKKTVSSDSRVCPTGNNLHNNCRAMFPRYLYKYKNYFLGLMMSCALAAYVGYELQADPLACFKTHYPAWPALLTQTGLPVLLSCYTVLGQLCSYGGNSSDYYWNDEQGCAHICTPLCRAGRMTCAHTCNPVNISESLGLQAQILRTASSNGQIADACHILRQTSDLSYILNDQDSDGQTPLTNAILHDFPELVRLLRVYGASPYITDYIGRDAIKTAYMQPNAPASFQFLTDTDLWCSDIQSIAPSPQAGALSLAQAVQQNQVGAICKLLQKNVDVNQLDRQNLTGLSWSASLGYSSVVNLLLHHGAQVDFITPGHHRTPLWLAVRQGNLASVMNLLVYGADQNIPDDNGNTPFILAAQKNRLDILRAFINPIYTSDFNCVNQQGNTALLEAVKWGSKEAVQLLLQYGVVDVDHLNTQKDNIITLAVDSGRQDVLEQLLSQLDLKKLNLNHKNQDGNTALMLAARGGYENCVQLLRLYGASVFPKNLAEKTAYDQAPNSRIRECLRSEVVCTNNLEHNTSQYDSGVACRTAVESSTGGTQVFVPDTQSCNDVSCSLSESGLDPDSGTKNNAKNGPDGTAPELPCDGFIPKIYNYIDVLLDEFSMLRYLDSDLIPPFLRLRGHITTNLSDIISKVKSLISWIGGTLERPGFIDIAKQYIPSLEGLDYELGERCDLYTIERSGFLEVSGANHGVLVPLASILLEDPEFRNDPHRRFCTCMTMDTYGSYSLKELQDTVQVFGKQAGYSYYLCQLFGKFKQLGLSLDDLIDEKTLLMHRVIHQDVPSIEVLLKLGADPNVGSTDTGKTALMYAAERSNRPATEMLVDFFDLKYTSQDHQGKTALMYAVQQDVTTKDLAVGKNSARLVLEAILSYGYRSNQINLQDNNRKTALHYAIDAGAKVGTLRLLLEYGANPVLLDNDQESPISYAAAIGSTKSLCLLLDKRYTDYNQVNASYIYQAHMSAVRYVSKKGDLLGLCSLLYQLDKSKNWQVANSQKQTPLMLALMQGNRGVVDILLQHGAQVTGADVSGTTVLMMALTQGYVDFVQKHLNDPNVDLNAVNSQNSTLLNMALRLGYKSVAEEILPKVTKAIIKQADKQENTPFSLAIQKGYYDIALRLLNQWADSETPDKLGYTPAAYAIDKNNDLIECLLSKGVDFRKVRSPYGRTLLTHAVIENDNDLLKAALAHSSLIDINLRDSEGNTPLYLAVYYGRLDMICQIVKFPNLDVNLRCKDDQTALIYAAKLRKSRELRGVLQCSDVKVNMQDREGNTALMYAVKLWDAGMVFDLLQSGSDVTIGNAGGETVWDLAGTNSAIITMLSSNRKDVW